MCGAGVAIRYSAICDERTYFVWEQSDDVVEFGDSILTGERVRLRQLRDEDIPQLCDWWRDPTTGLLQYQSVRPAPDSELAELFRKWSMNSGDDVGLSIETREGRELLGHVALFGVRLATRCATIGIVLGRQFWSQGYGTDAMRVVVRYGFAELGLHRLQLGLWSYNTRALAAYRTVGFREEGRRRESVFHDGVWYDEVLMGFLDREYYS
jgi:RimJ/RimL family protein N-acetyltransferase